MICDYNYNKIFIWFKQIFIFILNYTVILFQTQSSSSINKWKCNTNMTSIITWLWHLIYNFNNKIFIILKFISLNIFINSINKLHETNQWNDIKLWYCKFNYLSHCCVNRYIQPHSRRIQNYVDVAYMGSANFCWFIVIINGRDFIYQLLMD